MTDERWFFDGSTRKVLDENRLTVADVHSDAQDGRLLAAAPAMLAEIRHIVAHAECADGVATINTHDIEALERIIATIDNAEGRRFDLVGKPGDKGSYGEGR